VDIHGGGAGAFRERVRPGMPSVTGSLLYVILRRP